MTGDDSEPPGPGPSDDPAGRVIAAAGALLQAQTQANEAALQQLFAELRVLATLIPGTAPTKDEDDRFDDVPV